MSCMRPKQATLHIVPSLKTSLMLEGKTEVLEGKAKVFERKTEVLEGKTNTLKEQEEGMKKICNK